MKIFCIMGKSASGKDHIYKAVLEKMEPELKKVVIYTTRPKRDGETEGVEYHFKDEAFLKKVEENGKLVEVRGYNSVHGMWYYFTVDDGEIAKESDDKYLIIGTLEMFLSLKEYYGEDCVVPIYISVTDKNILERSMRRQSKQVVPDYREMCRRFLADDADFSTEKINAAGIKKMYDNNGDIEDCINMIVTDIEAANA